MVPEWFLSPIIRTVRSAWFLFLNEPQLCYFHCRAATMNVFWAVFKCSCWVLFLYQAWRCLDQYRDQNEATRLYRQKQQNINTPVICIGTQKFLHLNSSAQSLIPETYNKGSKTLTHWYWTALDSAFFHDLCLKITWSYFKVEICTCSRWCSWLCTPGGIEGSELSPEEFFEVFTPKLEDYIEKIQISKLFDEKGLYKI